MMLRQPAVGPACLRHLTLPLGGVPTMAGQFGRAVFGILCFNGRKRIVEVIADVVTSENLRCHQLGTNIPVPITKHELVGAARLCPKLGIGNRDGRTRSPGGAAEGEGIDTFCADHSRVRPLPRTSFDDDAFDRATVQQNGNDDARKNGTHRRRGWKETMERMLVISFSYGHQRFIRLWADDG